MEAESAQVVDSVSTVANALIVRISDAQAHRLARLPGVVRVHQARMLKLLLDHALPLNRVPDGWSLMGGMEKAGLGIKIAILDTGIDPRHPGFQDATLPVPAGFPRIGLETDAAYTNNKIIVARGYGRDQSPEDRHGHGTAVAMAAAGVPNAGPLARITGVAPKAYLGNYKITTGSGGSASDATIIKALDDAVADGMDVVNLSFGGVEAARPSEDILVAAIERASAAGVLVVTAAGNEGPDPNTMNSPATAPSAIAVGATTNDRVFAVSVTVEGLAPSMAIPGAGPNPAEPVTAPLEDVARLDRTGLACEPLPAASLDGQIALILRGVCTFEEKLNNAQRAGAVAGLVYTDAERPQPIIMGVGTATLASTMVSYPDGVRIKSRIADGPGVKATLRFTLGPFPADPRNLGSFSSRGPGPDLSVKPDLVAVGASLYTATQTANPSGMLYDASGYSTRSGTSFSAPLVAGAAAVLKGVRPGLTAQQYRSLIINTASPFALATSPDPAAVQSAGAGSLDLTAAIRSPLAAAPTSVSFGIGGGTVDVSRNVVISNIGTASDVFSVAVVPIGAGAATSVSTSSLTLARGTADIVTLRFNAAGLPPGDYQGFLELRGSMMESPIRIPYWYAVPSGIPRHLTILGFDESGAAGMFLRNAIQFRVTDASGIATWDGSPAVTVLAGDAIVTDLIPFDERIPGAYTVNVRLGMRAGENVFRIRAGELAREVTILSTSSSAAISP
jgi:subtilisin family serine protease